MNYTKLQVGDIRQATDEVKRTGPYGRTGMLGCGDDVDFTKWQPVRLIGHTILPADLIVAEFRREVAVD